MGDLRRFALAFLLLGLLPLPPASAQTEPVSLEARVTAQLAIENVFWRHREWPNSRPKPELSEVLSSAQARERVEAYLRESNRIAAQRGAAITDNELQAELDRIERNSRDRILLAEIFSALGNDRHLIAETLARATFVSRWPAVEGEAALSPNFESWTPISMVGAPAARMGFPSLWTGAEMIVFGGQGANFVTFNSGAKYVPATDTWIPIAAAPTARWRHSAVWSGTEMLVFGGEDGNALANQGLRYDPAADQWTTMSLVNCPAPREGHSAVWTGSQMIVWGGTIPPVPPSVDYTRTNTGGRYDPALDQWTPTSVGGSVPTPRWFHTSVWTGSRMVIWGGNAYPVYLADGARYDPVADAWQPVSTGANAPSAPSSDATAVWTGSEVILWGGVNPNGPVGWLGRYDPGSDTWNPNLATASQPSPRFGHGAVWTGSEMIVWGGSIHYNGFPMTDTGGRYNPATNTWVPTLGAPNAPSQRRQAATIWTGTEMIVWGGQYSDPLGNGARYAPNASAPTWFRDADGDGYGDPSVFQVSPTQPPGYVATAGDCNDTNASVHFGATELCNGVDDDCDGAVDDNAAPTCDDGNNCTNDSCVSGGCNHSQISCPPSGNQCVDNVCQNGACVSAPAVGRPCVLPDLCLQNTTCNASGFCNGTLRNCDNSNPCDTDYCYHGQCMHPPVADGSACDDGNACTQNQCQSGFCITFPGIPCNDGNGCTNDICNPSVGCSHTPITPPAEVATLTFSSADKKTMQWTTVQSATGYRIVRGMLAALPVGPYGGDESCWYPTGTTFQDTSVPTSGGYFYVVRAVQAQGSQDCGGSWGSEQQNLPGPPTFPARVTGTCP